MNYDQIYKAWQAVGAYVAGLKWDDFAKKLAEQPAQQEQGDSICQENDGCPTEKAVLQRFWRGQSIPDEHYPAWFKPAQQEPVVFYRCNGCGHAYEQVHPTSCDCMEAGGFDRVEYYTSPPYEAAPLAQRKPCQVWDAKGYDALCQELEGWKARAQRKPLTDEEIASMMSKNLRSPEGTYFSFARDIEAKLKANNSL